MKLQLKWYDGFFMSMLVASAISMALNWKKYSPCPDPLHVWIVVDYVTVFVFRCLMFVDSALAVSTINSTSEETRRTRFLVRLSLLVFLAFEAYPFLWTWTILGSAWLANSGSCLPYAGKVGFLLWICFCYCALLSVAIATIDKWRHRRRLLLVIHAAQPLSEYQMVLEMLRNPDIAGRMLSVPSDLEQQPVDAIPHHFGIYFTPAQQEMIEAAMSQLPRYRLKCVGKDWSTCPICLEEFAIDNEVRSLPCAHIFHTCCIDGWIRLNVKCPQCRCQVFPDLNLQSNSTRSPNSVRTSVRLGRLRRDRSGIRPLPDTMDPNPANMGAEPPLPVISEPEQSLTPPRSSSVIDGPLSSTNVYSSTVPPHLSIYEPDIVRARGSLRSTSRDDRFADYYPTVDVDPTGGHSGSSSPEAVWTADTPTRVMCPPRTSSL